MHKLLLADDSVTIQRVIELTFSGEDIQVIAVSDGEQAIARIPIEQPDIVLADIGMPKQSGYDVAAFISGHPELAHIPVLLLAGAFERVDEARAEQVKCAGVLVKPFEPRHVVSRVRELVSMPRRVPVYAAPVVPIVEVPAHDPAPDPVPTPVPDLTLAFAPEAAPEPVPPRVELKAEAPSPVAAPIQAPSPAPEPDSFLDESLDQYFERLNAAFTEPQRPLASTGGTPAPETSEGRSDRAESVDGYFDRLSAAFADLAKPVHESDELPASVDDLAIDPRVPTVDELIGADSAASSFAASVVETTSIDDSVYAPAVEAPPVPGVIEIPHDVPEGAGFAAAPMGVGDGDSAGGGEDLGGIADVLTALLAERSEPHEPAHVSESIGALSLESAHDEALVEEITNRVLGRLAPEVAARLRQLVEEELERIGGR